MRVADALAQARSHAVESLDAQLLLAHLMKVGRTWLIAHDDAPLDAELASHWASWLERRAGRRAAGLPARAQGVPQPRASGDAGGADSAARNRAAGRLGRLRCSRRAAASARSSTSVRAAARSRWRSANRIPTPMSSPPTPATRRWRSPVAMRRAWRCRSNSSRRPGGRDCTGGASTSSSPTRPTSARAIRHSTPCATSRERRWSPGHDGLDALRAIASQAPGHLNAGGWILLEHGFDQAEPVRALLRAAGLRDIETRQDLAGHSRVTGARRFTVA